MLLFCYFCTFAEHGLSVLDVDDLVREAIDAYKAGEVLQPPDTSPVSIVKDKRKTRIKVFDTEKEGLYDWLKFKEC